MNKEIYLIRGQKEESYAAFNARIHTLVKSLTNAVDTVAIRFTLTEQAPPAISIIPFGKQKIAAISIYKEGLSPVELLLQAVGFAGAYRVEEALPVAYEKEWEDGEATPGACLLTLFSRKKKLDFETFVDRWHNSHTPLSLKYHPLWNYNRNVVREVLTDDSTPFEGIVEEQVRERHDLLNPFRFFGNPLVIVPRMLMVYLDTKSFIDYRSMETYLAAEYHVRS